MRLAMMRCSPCSALAAAKAFCRPFARTRSFVVYRNTVIRCPSSYGSSSISSFNISIPVVVKEVPWPGQRRRWCSHVRAAQVSDPGSINPPLIVNMQNKIKEELQADSVVVRDSYGDGRHVTIVVIAKAFEGQPPVKRQRMVYKAIWEELQSTVHAVDHMSTLTPDEAEAQSSSSSSDL